VTCARDEVTKKKERQRKKPHSGKPAIRRDHPRRRIEMKFCEVGGLQEIVLRFEFHENQLSGFGAVGGRNMPFPIDLAIGLYNTLYYQVYHTSRDKISGHTALCGKVSRKSAKGCRKICSGKKITRAQQQLRWATVWPQ